MSESTSSRLPKVSVMIPTFNQEEYIKYAIDSVLMQDYPNIEIIVSDDCSTDDTGLIVHKYLDKRIKYYRNETRLGRVGNYHKCLYEYTTGEWVINLDGDDYYTNPTFISEAIEDILSAKNPVAYCFNYQNINYIRNKFPHTSISTSCISISGREYFINYYRIRYFGHMNVLYKRDIALSIGMYTLQTPASDFHSIVRLVILGNVLLNSKKIGVWRIHGNNTTIKEVNNRLQQDMQTLDAIEDFAKHHFTGSELSKWRKRMNKKSYWDYVSTYIFYNKNDLYGFLLLIKTFRFEYEYFRLWYYFIFGR